MTIIYILLGIIILSLIRIYGIARDNAIKLQNMNPKIHFMYEQVLKWKNEKKNQHE